MKKKDADIAYAQGFEVNENSLLAHGDCLEVMKNIPDNSIDLCLTDPPYGTTACKWDSVIPFKPMWEQLKRVTKDNGAICLFGSEPFSSNLRMSNIKMFKYDWYWKKSTCTCFVHAKRMPLRNVEMISVFYKQQPTYRPQGLKQINKKVTIPDNRGSNLFNSRGKERLIAIQEFTNYPKHFQEFKSESGQHTSQKPVPLLEYLINTYTLENETVLDFTMGSGSTGVACKRLKRKFIGIEKKRKYYNIARKRIYQTIIPLFI